VARKTFISRDTVLLLAALTIMGYQLVTDRIHWELCLVAMAFAGIPGAIGAANYLRGSAPTPPTTDASSESRSQSSS
jgi:hypothetical protein